LDDSAHQSPTDTGFDRKKVAIPSAQGKQVRLAVVNRQGRIRRHLPFQSLDHAIE
jgi:hypothetical protein